MPIYLYRNLATGETFEYEQRITDPSLTNHPETGEPVKRLIQPVGIVFKGSGFYVNDARKSNSTSLKPKDHDASSTPASTATPASAPESTSPSSSASVSSASATTTSATSDGA